MKKYTYLICGLFMVALAYFTFSGCQTTTTGPSGSMAHLTVQRGPKFGAKQVLAVMVDGARVASVTEGQAYNGPVVPRAACNICELKRPVSRYLAEEDYYGRSGAHLQLYCDVAGEALSLAIIRPTERCRNHGPLTAKALANRPRTRAFRSRSRPHRKRESRHRMNGSDQTRRAPAPIKTAPIRSDCRENRVFRIAVCQLFVTGLGTVTFRNGWQVYEVPGVQPVFLSQEQANVLSQTSSRPYRDKMTSRSSSRLVLVFAPLARLNPTRTVAPDTSQSAVLRSPRPAIQLC